MRKQSVCRKWRLPDPAHLIAFTRSLENCTSLCAVSVATAQLGGRRHSSMGSMVWAQDLPRPHNHQRPSEHPSMNPPSQPDLDCPSRIIVVGTSWGGVYALRDLVRLLPVDFAAPLIIVTHIGANRSVLPRLLSESGPLKAAHVVDGERLVPGRIYVAPPDLHVLVDGAVIRLNRGPKEHHTRPAIDPLFRSAALTRATDVIGVILTGMLDDGTAGLQAIKQYGGVAVVQDPKEASAPSMPASALKYVAVDHCVPIAAMAGLLTALAQNPSPATLNVAPQTTAFEEQDVFLGKGDAMTSFEAIGRPSGFVCPDCSGSLSEITASQPRRYRCHTGHAFTIRTLENAQCETVDMALWTALRSLQENYALLERMAAAARLDEDIETALRLANRAEAVGKTIASLRPLLEEVALSPEPSA
ncbi:MAG: protein-glutamate methylesterase (protein methylesterase)-like protein [Rhizobacter sp.]|nr:protein-glutamate methylesterase (protein methylesterase)-like protein [Rhizobacter sp.]